MWRSNAHSAELVCPGQLTRQEHAHGATEHAYQDRVSRRSSSKLMRINELRAHPFVRSVIVAVGGAATAQLITIAFSPLITRLYGPEAFGAVGVFTAAVIVIASISDLMYGAAIVLPPSETQARSLFKLSVIICVIISLLSLLGFGLFYQEIAAAIKFSPSPALLLLAPLLVLLSGLCQPLNHWLYRQGKFNKISHINVAEALTNNASKALVGLVTATAPALLILGVAAKMLQTVLLWLSARPSLQKKGAIQGPPEISISTASLKEAAYLYRDFPLFRAPQKWLKDLSYTIPSLMLASLLGPTAVGFYLLAARVIHLPNSVIADSTGPVFLARIAEASHRSESLRPILLRGTIGLAAIGLLPFGVVALTGPWLFGFVFGAGWELAGTYARWLSLSSYMTFVAVPTLSAIPLLGLQAQFLVYEIAVTLLGASALATGALMFDSDVAAIALFAVTGACMTLTQIMLCLGLCNHRTRGKHSALT